MPCKSAWQQYHEYFGTDFYELNGWGTTTGYQNLGAVWLRYIVKAVYPLCESVSFLALATIMVVLSIRFVVIVAHMYSFGAISPLMTPSPVHGNA